MMTAASLYGAATVTPNGAGVAAPTERMGSHPDISSGVRGLVDPNNPLVWAGVVMLVAFGAAGVAGSVRLGSARVAASVGKA